MRSLLLLLVFILTTANGFAAVSADCSLKALSNISLEEGLVVSFQNESIESKNFGLTFQTIRPGISRAKEVVTIRNSKLELIVEERDVNTLTYTTVVKKADSQEIFAASKLIVNGYDSRQIGLIFKTPRKIFKKDAESFELNCSVHY